MTTDQYGKDDEESIPAVLAGAWAKKRRKKTDINDERILLLDRPNMNLWIVLCINFMQNYPRTVAPILLITRKRCQRQNVLERKIFGEFFFH